MTRYRPSAQKSRIVFIIDRLRRLWLNGHIDEAEGFLDDGIVTYVPWSKRRIEGKRDFIRVFQDLRANFDIKRCDASDLQIAFHGGVSLAHCRLSIEYVRGKEHHTGSGLDFLVFAFREGAWRLARRSIVLDPWPRCG